MVAGEEDKGRAFEMLGLFSEVGSTRMHLEAIHREMMALRMEVTALRLVVLNENNSPILTGPEVSSIWASLRRGK